MEIESNVVRDGATLTLTQSLKDENPKVFDAVTDLNLCAAVCYIRMH